MSQSLVVVYTGQVSMYQPARWSWSHRRPRCEVSMRQRRDHPEGAHNFVNTGRAADGTAVECEIYIIYFVPTGASPAIDVTPAPAGCPA